MTEGDRRRACLIAVHSSRSKIVLEFKKVVLGQGNKSHAATGIPQPLRQHCKLCALLGAHAQQPAMPRLAVLYSYQISGRILWSIYRLIAAVL
jgi:hypothetical protein